MRVQGYNFIQESTGTETCFGRDKGRLLKMEYKQICTSGAETIDTEKRKKKVQVSYLILLGFDRDI